MQAENDTLARQAPGDVLDGGAADPRKTPRRGWRPSIGHAGAGVLILTVALRPWLAGSLDTPAFRTWTTIFVSVCMQALPFLVLGVVLSGLLAAFLKPGALERVLPRNRALAVPVAGLAGIGLPGCECSSVPIAGRLVAGGAPPAAALTFLLAAPAVNPVVLVATAVAFPGRPMMVVARFVASLLTSIVVGWLWLRFGRDEFLDRARRRHVVAETRWGVFTGTAAHDLLHAGGFLVVGGLTAATLQVLVPTAVLDSLANSGPLAVLALAGLAVILAICSEADAFVAASLTQFSPTARLAFLVVGPTVDIKLIAPQAGTFGRQFAIRFAPLTFAVAVLMAWITAAVLL